MKLKPEWKAERDRYVAKFPLPHIADGEGDDVWTDRIRRWNTKLAEQLAWKFPDAQLAVKRGDSGRPICKDCLAQMALITPETGPSFYGLIAWDNMSAASSGHPTLNSDPDSLALYPGTPDGGTDGQFFENRPEYFKPQDHVGEVVPVPIPTPTPTTHALPDWLDMGHWIDSEYATIFGRPLSDSEAVVNWIGYHWRENGRSKEWIHARLLEAKAAGAK